MKKKSDESSAPRMNAPHQVRKRLRNDRMRHLQFDRPGIAERLKWTIFDSGTQEAFTECDHSKVIRSMF